MTPADPITGATVDPTPGVAEIPPAEKPGLELAVDKIKADNPTLLPETPAPRGDPGTAFAADPEARAILQAAASFPMSIRLIKRLAEAVDGLRGSQQFFVVARFAPEKPESFDFEFLKFPTEAEAQTAAVDRNRALKVEVDHPVFGVFGPFAATDGVARTHSVMNVILKLRGLDGETTDFDVAAELTAAGETVNPDEPLPCDALFWSLSANEKFLEPYYTRAENLASAAQVRTAFLEPDFVVGVHLPTTEILKLAKTAAVVFNKNIKGTVGNTFIDR